LKKDMLKLENVTLVSVSSVEIERTVKALEYSSKDIEFAEILFLTDKEVEHESIKVIKIDSIDYIQYSEFIIYKLHKYINTDYVLIVQNDGFVINADMWDDEFFEYDYIGAPFPIPKEGDDISYRSPFGELIRVGNGGFSLRSKRILELASELGLEWKSYYNFWNEDGFFAVHNRHIYEEHGCVFAPIEVAAKFSHEQPVKETANIKPFGFHGKGSKYASLI
jgi:hypothetical protein